MVRHYLDLKLWRDLRKHLGSLIAIAIVVACGISIFVTMRSIVYVLEDARSNYYNVSRLPDIFAQVSRAPDAVLPELRSVPGISRIHVRSTGEVALRVPGLREPATARIVGTRPQSQGTLNHVVLKRGRLPVPGELDAVVVSEGFAEANRLALGDTLGAVIGSRWRQLRVVGIGISAEFVYELRPGDMFPDSRRYGVLWGDDALARQAFGMEGAWNDLGVTLAPGASEAAVIAALDARLARYGSFGAYGRDLHPSHQFLDQEIRGNRTFGVVLPTIFLAVAAFLVNLVLGRIVVQQRDQIGTLKAFGFPSSAIVRHYILFALVPVLAGSLLGLAVGYRLISALAGVYREFFRFPLLEGSMSPGVIAVAVLIGCAAAIIGALSALMRVLALPAAEAMRPEAPATYAHGITDRVLGQRGTPVTRMIVRGLTHRPWRTLLGALGIGFGSAVVVAGSFGFEAVDRMREVMFTHSMKADVSVVFAESRGRDVIHALRRLPGVVGVEARSDLPVRVSRGHRSRQTALIGIDESARLRHMVNLKGERVQIPHTGVILSASLGSVLDVAAGDSIDIEFLDGRLRKTTLVVSALIDDISGGSVYVSSEWIPILAGVGVAITAADLSVDAEELDQLYEQLAAAPGVRSVLVRDALIKSFDETIEKTLSVTLLTLVIFAAALSAGTIYNAGRVALSERARDLASLRILGFTRGEVARILIGELVILTAIGIPAGLLIGVGFAVATVNAFGDTELFRMPLVIGPRTILAGITVPVVAGVFSLFPIRHRLDRLDLIAVLKTRE